MNNNFDDYQNPIPRLADQVEVMHDEHGPKVVEPIDTPVKLALGQLYELPNGTQLRAGEEYFELEYIPQHTDQTETLEYEIDQPFRVEASKLTARQFVIAGDQPPELPGEIHRMELTPGAIMISEGAVVVLNENGELMPKIPPLEPTFVGVDMASPEQDTTGSVDINECASIPGSDDWPDREGFYDQSRMTPFDRRTCLAALAGSPRALIRAFDWSLSREGRFYWEKIFSGITPLDNETKARLQWYLDNDPSVKPKPENKYWNAKFLHEPFWIVWNPSGGNPTCKHKTEADARREADRLSTKSPMDHFFVLQATHLHIDEIPF